MDFHLPIPSSVDYFTPLHVNTNIEYILNKEKFPEINNASYHWEPALVIAPGNCTEETSASEEEDVQDISQSDLFSLIESLDVDDFPEYDDEEMSTLNLFEDSSVCLDISPVPEDNQTPIHFYTFFPVSEALPPTQLSSMLPPTEDIVSNTALELSDDIQLEVTEQGKRKQNTVAISEMSPVEYCKRRKTGPSLSCDFTKDLGTPNNAFRPSDIWTISNNGESLYILTGAREG